MTGSECGDDMRHTLKTCGRPCDLHPGKAQVAELNTPCIPEALNLEAILTESVNRNCFELCLSLGYEAFRAPAADIIVQESQSRPGSHLWGLGFRVWGSGA